MATGLDRYFWKIFGRKVSFWFHWSKLAKIIFCSILCDKLLWRSQVRNPLYRVSHQYCPLYMFRRTCLGGHLNAHHLIAKWAINIFTSTLHCGVVWSIHRIDLQLLAWLSSVQGVHFNMAWPVFSGYSTSTVSGGSMVGTGLLLRRLEVWLRSRYTRENEVNPSWSLHYNFD